MKFDSETSDRRLVIGPAEARFHSTGTESEGLNQALIKTHKFLDARPKRKRSLRQVNINMKIAQQESPTLRKVEIPVSAENIAKVAELRKARRSVQRKQYRASK